MRSLKYTPSWSPGRFQDHTAVLSLPPEAPGAFSFSTKVLSMWSDDMEAKMEAPQLAGSLSHKPFTRHTACTHDGKRINTGDKALRRKIKETQRHPATHSSCNAFIDRSVGRSVSPVVHPLLTADAPGVGGGRHFRSSAKMVCRHLSDDVQGKIEAPQLAGLLSHNVFRKLSASTHDGKRILINTGDGGKNTHEPPPPSPPQPLNSFLHRSIEGSESLSAQSDWPPSQ
mmetsp:Transcript_9737/g.18896  ORF Transcript_9737/g.18896 Transcript_9737/m.18896 type:complete len:228 (+) Transcript_9737:185-868(+)